MTRDQKIKVLSDALDRAYQAVENSSADDMREHWFSQLMNNLGQLEEMCLRIHFTKDKEMAAPDQAPETDANDSGTTKESLEAPAEAPVAETVQEPVQEQEQEQVPAAEESGKPEETYEGWQVRAALANLKSKSKVEPKDLLKSFGFNGFSSVPADRYPAIMKAVKEQELAHAT